MAMRQGKLPAARKDEPVESQVRARAPLGIIAQAEAAFPGNRDVAVAIEIYQRSRSERLLRALEGRLKLHASGELASQRGRRQ